MKVKMFIVMLNLFQHLLANFRVEQEIPKPPLINGTGKFGMTVCYSAVGQATNSGGRYISELIV
jgi:hypothetical protein